MQTITSAAPWSAAAGPAGSSKPAPTAGEALSRSDAADPRRMALAPTVYCPEDRVRDCYPALNRG